MSTSTILLICSISLNAAAYACYLISKVIEKCKIKKVKNAAIRSEKARVEKLKDELYKDYLKTIHK